MELNIFFFVLLISCLENYTEKYYTLLIVPFINTDSTMGGMKVVCGLFNDAFRNSHGI